MVFRDSLSELFVLFGILQITHYLYIVILERLVVLSFLFNFVCVFERDPLLIIWILYLWWLLFNNMPRHQLVICVSSIRTKVSYTTTRNFTNWANWNPHYLGFYVILSKFIGCISYYLLFWESHCLYFICLIVCRNYSLVL